MPQDGAQSSRFMHQMRARAYGPAGMTPEAPSLPGVCAVMAQWVGECV